jgi:hypothetical protein
MYAAQPKFGEKVPGQPHRHYMTEIHMGSDRELLASDGEGLPVYEGRMIDCYDYRAKGYAAGRGRASEWLELPFDSLDKAVVPQWRIHSKNLPAKLRARVESFRVGFCDVVNPETEKCLVAALIPPGAVCGHKVPTLMFENGGLSDLLLWLGVANSLTMDFLVRKKVRLTMSYNILDSLPFPRYSDKTKSSDAIVERVLALTAVGKEMPLHLLSRHLKPGIKVLPASDPAERERLRAEIEVLVAHEVFLLNLGELRYILDPVEVLGPDSDTQTFRVLRDRELRLYGEYRTQRLILESWNRMLGEPTSV